MAMSRNGRMSPTAGAINATVSFVEAPKCSSCGGEMVWASATEWKCSGSTCPENGKAKNTGVFPVR